MSSFEYEEGDTLLVRVREGGKLVAKFVAEVHSVVDKDTTTHVALVMPFSSDANTAWISPHEAEFEKVEDVSELHF